MRILALFCLAAYLAFSPIAASAQNTIDLDRPAAATSRAPAEAGSRGEGATASDEGRADSTSPETKPGDADTSSDFMAALTAFGQWVVDHYLPLLISLGVLWLLACALTALFMKLHSVRPLAAPRLGMLAAFVLWVVSGVVLWPLLGWGFAFLPAWAFIVGLHWGLWVILGVAMLGVIAGLTTAAARQASY